MNNQGLVLYEIGQEKEAIKKWKEVIKITKDAEPLLALASAIQRTNFEEALKLAQKALEKNPNYVFNQYQKEQLWGTKLRLATKNLLDSPEMIESSEKARELSK